MPPRLNAGGIAPERGPRCIMAILKDNGRICKGITPFPPLSYPPTGPAIPHRPESRHGRMHLRKFICVLIIAMPRWGSLPAGPSHRFSLDSRRLQMIGCALHSRKKASSRRRIMGQSPEDVIAHGSRFLLSTRDFIRRHLITFPIVSSRPTPCTAASFPQPPRYLDGPHRKLRGAIVA